jgi:hypothetical protein
MCRCGTGKAMASLLTRTTTSPAPPRRRTFRDVIIIFHILLVCFILCTGAAATWTTAAPAPPRRRILLDITIIFHKFMVYYIICTGLKEDRRHVRRDVEHGCSRPAQAPPLTSIHPKRICTRTPCMPRAHIARRGWADPHPRPRRAAAGAGAPPRRPRRRQASGPAVNMDETCFEKKLIIKVVQAIRLLDSAPPDDRVVDRRAAPLQTCTV